MGLGESGSAGGGEGEKGRRGEGESHWQLAGRGGLMPLV